jgi:acetolactate synthase-1/2/3 large subunit
MPLDIQAIKPLESSKILEPRKVEPFLDGTDHSKIFEKFFKSLRPVLLLGGGLSREFCEGAYQDLLELKIPIMTTWNGADRFGAHEKNYWGRPNTWGQRYSNVLLQQADFVIAVGTRLGLQQTVFNWKGFAPKAELIQVDLDLEELKKGHPNVSGTICTDADSFLRELLDFGKTEIYDHREWLSFGDDVKNALPLSESANVKIPNFINPYDFVLALSKHLKYGDVVIPSSSGASMTVTMQSLIQPKGCRVVTNKSLASMGYGLAGAIGTALQTKGRIIHIEGDGGFLQNIQDLGTIRKQKLPIKTFIFSNGGYASIRMTQLNYFGGEYIGCDEDTGLGLPDWELLAKSFGINFYSVNPDNIFDQEVVSRLNSPSPEFFLVPISQEQTYFPKISSRVTESGGMESNPLHLMSPELSPEDSVEYLKYLT